MTATRSRAFALMLLALAAACLATGCGQDRASDPAAGDDGGMASLPSPEAGDGSVTGLRGARADIRASAPATGPAGNPFDLAGADGEALDADGNPLPAGDGVAAVPGEPGIAPGANDALPPPAGDTAVATPSPTEPGADEAVGVVRRYYGAIDARQYEQAWQLWAGNGRASGQGAAAFAGGFVETAGVSVQTGAPGRVEGAAGSRYIQVPVSVRAVHVDGSEHRYEGSYTLRRAVVDGASADQRAWRIDSADLREVPL